ncbi:Mannan endo-1,6-alpha-mannosidase DCW1-like protein 2 [Phlyctema vagabunda]|uniref:Mannan endo-1,6-alpha-mannosidase n=1 Tax=Phlyctema vagabunda TaxID=108571 RepID=A0ABR4PYV0_9HELO
MRSFGAYAALVAAFAHTGLAVELTITDRASIQNATSKVAYGLMKYYTGNVTNTPETIAVLPKPHYWWQAGAMWGILLDYYHYTGDETYNNVTTQALLSQVGPEFDYMVPLREKEEGNDDQAFWGFATMAAAEMDYPAPTVGPYSWLQLTENLWNTQARRWDTTSCGGGLKWQIFPFNNGYDYKNAVSNGAFFQLSARLARFTGNQTYVEWAGRVYDWTKAIGIISDTYDVFDGSDDKINCTELNHITWSYSNGIFLYGSAVLYNLTNGSTIWQERTQGFLESAKDFFSPFENSTNVMYENACEPYGTCNVDQFSFKGYLARFMWKTTLMAAFTASTITTLLETSAQSAATACSGPANGFSNEGETCGQKWYTGDFDGSVGAGQQMSALEVLQGLLISGSVPPLHQDQVRINASPTLQVPPVPRDTDATSGSPAPSSPQNAAKGIQPFQILAVAGVVGSILLGL